MSNILLFPTEERKLQVNKERLERVRTEFHYGMLLAAYKPFMPASKPLDVFDWTAEDYHEPKT
jgi:hypothetical protein